MPERPIVTVHSGLSVKMRLRIIDAVNDALQPFIEGAVSHETTEEGTDVLHATLKEGRP